MLKTRGWKPRNISSAFTLIELLVVISIISLLMAILLPALQSAREASLVTRCSANLRQLGIGLYAYEADNDELPDGPATQSSTRASLRFWRRDLYDAMTVSYGMTDRILQCPTKETGTLANNSYGQNFSTSYAIVTGRETYQWFGAVPDGPAKNSPRTTYDAIPENGIMAADNLSFESRYIFNHETLGYMGANVLYVGGHVHWSTWEHGLDATITNVSQDYRGGNSKWFYFGDGTP